MSKIGASTKRENAQRISRGESMVFKNKKNKQSDSNAIPLTILFALCVVLAGFISQDFLSTSGLNLTGNRGFDHLLFGPGIPEVFTDADINKVFVFFIRGFALFSFCGIFPMMTYLYANMGNRHGVSIYLIIWGVGVTFFILLYLLAVFLLPMMGDLGDKVEWLGAFYEAVAAFFNDNVR